MLQKRMRIVTGSCKLHAHLEVIGRNGQNAMCLSAKYIVVLHILFASSQHGSESLVEGHSTSLAMLICTVIFEKALDGLP